MLTLQEFDQLIEDMKNYPPNVPDDQWGFGPLADFNPEVHTIGKTINVDTLIEFG